MAKPELAPAPAEITFTELLPFHPLADVFPLMEGDDFAKLVDGITQNGQRDSVVTLDGQILDGRNRARACIAAGIPYRTKEFPDGEDPVAFVIDLNLHRRQMTPSQCSMVAAKLANLSKGRPKENGSIDPFSQPRAAEALNVSVPSVRRAKTVLDHGDPELINKVERGEMSVSRAANEVRGKKAEAKPKPKATPDIPEKQREGVPITPGAVRDLYETTPTEIKDWLAVYAGWTKKQKDLAYKVFLNLNIIGDL